ncbi:hypothetical protein A33M_2428 [Rhodovulum sp. PH10]|uniref:SDR family oxidoreductase n=1 Tax=Rhodovulum sp. PH10 TaxID=1187851 RepID=UPI00027C2C13|nr:SDR family oxidoreductase [Rhodovulum sp. PH10]EJW12090.1 hypothetical protein A33M_2428 [Rhodovulum sp. PH10]
MQDTPNLAGKTVVITGATGGLGLEAAIGIAAMQANLVLVGRNHAKGEAALARIRREVPGAVAEMHYADLTRLDDIRALAATLNEQLPRIDVLLNNAGSMFAKRDTTADGFECTFGLDHMAYFALTLLLWDKLVQSAPSRIVNIASEAHRGVTLDFENLQYQRPGSYSAWQAYRRAKLCNVLFTRELARRLDGTGVTANCVHPGFVATGFGDNNRGLYGLAIRFTKLFAIPLKEGVKTPVHAATSPEIAGKTGLYLSKSKPCEPSAAAKNDETARRLWDESLRLSGLEDRGQGREVPGDGSAPEAARPSARTSA